MPCVRTWSSFGEKEKAERGCLFLRRKAHRRIKDMGLDCLAVKAIKGGVRPSGVDNLCIAEKRCRVGIGVGTTG